MSTQDFKPFENDVQSITLLMDTNGNGITIENGKDKVIIYGDAEVSINNRQSLDNLIGLLQKIRGAD